MNRACVLKNPKQLIWEERAPLPLKTGEVRIRSCWAGICGTDLALYSGDYEVPLPLVLGHEFCGEVDEVSRSEDEHLIGKIVAPEINHHCLARLDSAPCGACKRGLPLHCLKRSVFGIIAQDGAFQSETIALALNCHVLPDSLTGPQGIFIEPLAAALNTFSTVNTSELKFVLVLGAGRLGSLIAMIAQRVVENTLVVCRSDETKNRLARLDLNSMTFPGVEELRAIIDEQTDGVGADMVIEATGDPNMLQTCLNLVRPRGIVSLKSTPGLPTPPLDLTKWVVDEITVQGTRCGDFAKAIEFYQCENLDLTPLISHIVPFENIEDAFALAHKGGKVVIEF
jgi:threonine dehydrogenase-like Zn-dependent dehydrogenase